jgi:hypothetical protein
MGWSLNIQELYNCSNLFMNVLSFVLDVCYMLSQTKELIS